MSQPAPPRRVRRRRPSLPVVLALVLGVLLVAAVALAASVVGAPDFEPVPIPSVSSA